MQHANGTNSGMPCCEPNRASQSPAEGGGDDVIEPMGPKTARLVFQRQNSSGPEEREPHQFESPLGARFGAARPPALGYWPISGRSSQDVAESMKSILARQLQHYEDSLPFGLGLPGRRSKGVLIMPQNSASAFGVLRRDPEPVRTEHATSGFTVLALSPDAEDHSSLAQLCSHEGWGFRSAHSARLALRVIRSKPVAVVICERDLPDGDWRDVLDDLQRLPTAPLMIVVSRLADEALWAEVLNLGGYDVLLKPFELKELMWSVTSAFRQWESQPRLRFAPRPCPPAA